MEILLSLISNQNYFNMKWLFFFFLPLVSFGQDKFKVEYERRYFTVVLNSTPEKAKQLEDAFSKPKYIELLVDGNRCSSKEVERIDNSQGQRYKMEIIGGYRDLETYFDFDQNAKIVSREMDSKIYLINDTISAHKWNITRETKTINGYEARKAILKDQHFEKIAWYAPTIKSKCGPSDFNGLPGLLLELKSTSLKDQNQYSTYKLEMIKVDEKLKIQEPIKGKKVSLIEFDKIEEEYSKKVQEMVKPNQGVDRTE